MATLGKRTECREPGCHRTADGAYCDQHRKPKRARSSPAARGYDRSWQKLREAILARDPTCRHCGLAPSTDVDHIKPKRDGGSDHPANLQGLCHRCHSRKTALGL